MKLHHALEMTEGDGVTVRRLMPIVDMRHHDPFVLWDDFTLRPGSGFPTHPHRGFEAITYLFSGSLCHEDNLGNASTVTEGGAQHFTAGRGLNHSEMPNDATTTRGIQLWINLPQRLKQIDPSYQQVGNNYFPVDRIDGVTIKTLVGDGSPLKLRTKVNYLDISLNDGANYTVNVPSNMRGFIYMVAGTTESPLGQLKQGDATLLEQQDTLLLKGAGAARLMLCLGQPHGEPIIQHGPYVD